MVVTSTGSVTFSPVDVAMRFVPSTKATGARVPPAPLPTMDCVTCVANLVSGTVPTPTVPVPIIGLGLTTIEPSAAVIDTELPQEPFAAVVARPFASNVTLAQVYAAAVTPLVAKVVATAPALVVMSPVKAGI